MALLVTGIIIAYVARENFSVALADKTFKSIFNLKDSSRGTLNSAFFWSYAFLQIPAGWIVDRYGVKWPYAISFLFWSVISAGTALAGTISQLFALRFLLGVGESVATPASLRWIRFHFGEHQRGLAIGLHMAGTKLGPAIGAWIAVRLLVSSGWQAMFIILGIGSLLWLIPWVILAKDDDRKIEQAAQSRSTAKSVSFGKLMANRVIWGTMIGTFCYMYFVYYCMTWMPAYFVEQRGGFAQEHGLVYVLELRRHGGRVHSGRMGGRPYNRARRRSGWRTQGLHDSRLCHGLDRGDRSVVALGFNGSVFRCVFAERARACDRQLLGVDADFNSWRRDRQDRRHSELRREYSRYRRAHIDRLADTEDRQL